MPEFLTRISNQLTAFWNRFERKQKIQLISVIAVAIVALSALVIVLNQPNFELYADDLDAKTVNEIKTQLDAEAIPYQISDDATAIYVEAGRKKDATLALESLGILSNSDMSYQDLFNTGITTTQYEKALRYQIYFEGELARKIEEMDIIDSAEVKLVIPNEDRTIFDENIQSKGTALITTAGEINDQQVQGIVAFLASSVANLDKENISIIDNSGLLLYDGSAQGGSGVSLMANMDYERQQETLVQQKVRSILLSRGEYDDAFVTVDLAINFDEVTIVKEDYSTEDGSTKGIVEQEDKYVSESTNTDPANVVGTDANDGTTDTMTGTTGESSAAVEDTSISYKVDKEQTTAYKASGGINYENSTISVVLNKFITYDQALLETEGALADITWEQFKAQNDTRTKVEVDPELVTLINGASGNIPSPAVVAYEVPRFIDKEVTPSPMSDYILIGIIVMMISLLGYAVYKGTEPVEIVETEPELSVEDMLETTQQPQKDMDPIEFSEKSEARQQIEKFVDDNPAAVALLLRNWLNEEWE